MSDYYTQKLHTAGPSPQGVDWNSTESQELRFAQLLKLCARSEPFSLLDYGCGYGALFDFTHRREYPLQRFQGYDIAPEMIRTAAELHTDAANCQFTANEQELLPADYVVASGIFNVRQEVSNEEWWSYTCDTLAKLARLSQRGFAFNMLTSYSDAEKMRPQLFYPNPCHVFDYCKRNFSKWVALLHDYGLYEFTIHVRL